MAQKTGYPSIDRPWLKYYSEEAINAPLPECTMYEYIWQHNREHLSDIALRYYGAKISYGQLFDSIKRAAAAFRAMGVKAGDIVTIMSMHTPETIAAIYGLNYLGAVANLVYMTLSPKEIVGTLGNTESKLLLILDAAVEKLDEIKAEIAVPVVVLGVSDSMPAHMKLGYKLKARTPKHDYMTWKAFLARGDASALPAPASDHAAPAVIVYTSGTTGEPKGVVLNGDNLNSVAEQLCRTDRNYQRQDTVLMILPPFIIFGASMIHLGLYNGMDVILCIQLDNDAIGKLFDQYKPKRYVAGPMYLEGLVKHGKGDMSGVVDITGGGDSITPEQEETFNAFLKAHGSPTQYMTGYGMSEVSAAVVLNLACANRRGSLGVPLPQTNVKLCDPETRREVPFGEIGEICFHTPGIMQGYYKNEEATAECVEYDDDGRKWLHTGDLGCMDEDGFLFFKGRIKRIHMILGSDGFAYKLFPQRIEEYLEEQEGIIMAAVIVREDAEVLHTANAFVVLEPTVEDADAYLERLREKMLRDVPEHLRPASIRPVSELPSTPSGKIDYRALEALAGE